MQGQRSGLHSFPDLHEVEIGSSSNLSHFDQANFFFDTVGAQQGYAVNHAATPQLHGSLGQENLSFKMRDSGGPSTIKHCDESSEDTKVIEGSQFRSRRGGIRIEDSGPEEPDSFPRENMDFDLNINHDDPVLHFPQSENVEAHAANLAISCQNLNSVPENSHNWDNANGSSSNTSLNTAGGSRGKELFLEGGGRQLVEQEDLSASHKRKSVEGAPGFCAGSRGLSNLHIGEIRLLPPPSSQSLVGKMNIPSSSNYPFISSPDEQKAPFVDINARPSAFDTYGPNAGSTGSSHRNTRLRIAQPRHNYAFMPTPLPQGTPAPQVHQRNVGLVNRVAANEIAPSFASANQFNGEYNLVDSSAQQQASFAGQDRYPHPWGISPNARVGSSSTFANIEDEESVLEETIFRSMSRRNISEHLRFVPPSNGINETNASWRFTLGSRNFYGSSAPQNQSVNNAAPHIGANAASSDNIQPQLPSGLLEADTRSFGNPLPASGVSMRPYSRSAILHELAIGQTPASTHEQQPTSSRSNLPRQRQSGGGLLGVPLSGTARRDIRTRMLALAEARNMLTLLRRGERLRLEDMAILDHPVFLYGSDMFDRHREMRLDVDNMSYEELLELEERIGNVNTGLTEEKITKCMKQRKYVTVDNKPLEEIEPCCICREEYVEGEDLGRLDCGHDFHTGCIKQWLLLKNLCPICKTTALST